MDQQYCLAVICDFTALQSVGIASFEIRAKPPPLDPLPANPSLKALAHIENLLLDAAHFDAGAHFDDGRRQQRRRPRRHVP
jgi:hypothetical protein